MTRVGVARYGPLDAVAFASIFVFGIVMALLGAVMPLLSARLALGLEEVATLFLVTNGAMLAASVVVGPAMDRYGMKPPLAIGTALVGAALVAIAWAPSMGVLLPALAGLGLGGGALNAGANTLVADLHEDPVAKGSALNLLGVFFGVGALLLPFSVGALLASVGLPGLLAAGAALCGATTVAVLVLGFPPPHHAQGWPLANVGRFVAMPVVLTLAFLLFFQSGNEFVLGGYLTTFLTQDLAMPVERSSYLLAAYWASIMAGRLILSRGPLALVGAHTIVLGAAGLAAVGALAIGLAPSVAVAVAGVIFTGLALAGVYPTVLGIAGVRFREHSGTVFGILFTIGLAGGMTMPWLAGHMAAWAGLRIVFVLVATNFLAVAVLSAVARHR